MRSSLWFPGIPTLLGITININIIIFLSSNIKEIVINSYAHSIVSHDHLFCFRYLTHPVLTKEIASCVGFLPPAIEKSA